MAENLLNVLDKHFEDETTNGWILSSLSKLYTVPGINTGDRILEKFNKYSNSKYLDLQQRSVEYKLLSEFGSSSDLDYDSTLSFLSHYVDQAKRTGARDYDVSKKTRGMLAGLALGANTTEGGLKVTPYTQDNSKPRAAAAGGGEATGLKVTQNKWDKGGYTDTKHQSNINNLPQSLSAQFTKAISSQDIQKGKIFPGFNKAPGVGSPNTVMGGGLTSSLQSSSTQPKYEDPSLKERQKEASALFAGLQGSAGAKPATTTTTSTPSTVPKTTTTTTTTSTMGGNPFGVPSRTTTTTGFGNTGTTTFGNTNTTAQKGNPFQASSKPATTTTFPTTTKPTPTTATTSASATIDLLDMDFGVGSTPQPTQTTQPSQPSQPSSGGFDLLGGFGGSTGGNFGGSNTSGGFGGNFGSPFGGAPAQPQQPSYAGKYNNINLSLEMYEQYWNDLPEEVSENVQANVRSVNDFRNLLNKVSLGFVSEIEGEVLGAGKRTSGEFVLIYARINPNGTLEVQSKSSSRQVAQELIQHLREASKK